MANNLLQLVEEGYAQNQTGVCLAVKRDGEWQETSIPDFKEGVDQLAAGLYELGIRKGDRVGLHSENSTEWVMTDLAILSLGAITVPIYATQPGDQILFILQDAGAKVHFVSSAKLYEKFAPYVDQLPDVQLVGILGRYHERMLTTAEVQALGRERLKAEPHLLETPRASITKDDLASFIYTSGTTGMPKGVMLTHGNMLSNIEAIIKKGFFLNPSAHRGAKLLSYLPLSHIFERMMSFLALKIGYPMYFIPNIDNFLQDIQEVKPVHFTTVPRLLEKVFHGIQTKVDASTGLKGKLGKWAVGKALAYSTGQPRSGLSWTLADKLVYSKLRGLFGGELVGITSGGAALPTQIMNFMNGIGIPTAQGYGLTETSPVITMYDVNALKPGSAGILIPDVKVRLEPVEGGENGEGEIVVTGPNVMKGYYNRPDANAEVFTEDGWFRTGDIGRFDQDGHLYITDRKKELLKLSTGKYVAPAPIENELVLSEYVEQAVVIGNGQKFCSALIVPSFESIERALKEKGITCARADFESNAEVKKIFEKVLTQCNKGLPHWEQVKMFRLLPEAFSIEGGELTPKLSMKRRVIQEKYKSQIASMYE